jgi:hypothetical protein
MKGWRRDALGERLVRIYEGAETVSLGWSDGSLRAKRSTTPGQA